MRVIAARDLHRAVQHGLVQHVLAHGDGGDMEHRIDMRRSVVAEELAVRPLDLGVAGLVEITLDDELRVGRHRQAVRHAAHHRQRRAAQRRHGGALIVAGRAHTRRQEVERMRADREIEMQVLAALDAGEEHALEIGHLREVRQHRILAAQHQPAAADIAPPGRGIDRIVDGGGEIRRAVIDVLHVERQSGEVDVVARDHHLLHRRVGLRHLDHRLRGRHAAREFLRQVALVGHAEGGGVAAAAAADRPDDLEMLGTGVLEQRRLRRCLDHRADVRQRDRAIVDVDLADRDQVFDKTSQPEFFEIDTRHGLPAWFSIAALAAAIRTHTRHAIRATNKFPMRGFSRRISAKRRRRQRTTGANNTSRRKRNGGTK